MSDPETPSSAPRGSAAETETREYVLPGDSATAADGHTEGTPVILTPAVGRAVVPTPPLSAAASIPTASATRRSAVPLRVALIIALIAVGAFGVTFVSVRGWIQHQARTR